MPVYAAAILAAAFLAAGVLFLFRGRRTGKRAFILAGLAAFILCAGCVVYLAATLLLVSGIA